LPLSVGIGCIISTSTDIGQFRWHRSYLSLRKQVSKRHK